jgi:hypothetical protein
MEKQEDFNLPEKNSLHVVEVKISYFPAKFSKFSGISIAAMIADALESFITF